MVQWQEMVDWPNEPIAQFYEAEDSSSPYGVFSNFYVHEPFEFSIPSNCRSRVVFADGKRPTSVPIRYTEKAIMLCKAAIMGDEDAFDAIVAASSPAEDKAFGRKVRNFDQALWNRVVCDVAVDVVTQKFRSIPRLRDILLSTGNALIAEATANDKVWGIGLDRGDPLVQDPRTWKGSNILGWALMTARERLKQEPVDATPRLYSTSFTFSNEFDDMPLPGDLGPEPSPYSSRIIAESTHSLLLMDWLKCLWCCKK